MSTKKPTTPSSDPARAFFTDAEGVKKFLAALKKKRLEVEDAETWRQFV